VAEAHAAAVEQAARAAERQAARRLAEARIAEAADVSTRERLRRARRVAGLLALAGVATAGVQLWLMASTGVVPGAWLVLAGCVAAVALSGAVQRRIVARTRMLAPVAARPVARRGGSTLLDAEPITPPASREWT